MRIFTCKIAKNKSSYTLIELLIVIAILSIFFSLYYVKFEQKEQKKDFASEILSLFKNRGDSVFVIYSNRCDKVVFNGKNISLSTPKPLKVYTVDKYDRPKEVYFTPIFIDGKAQKVCLALKRHKNLSYDSYIIKAGGVYYVIYPFFQDYKKFDTLKEAAKAYKRSDYMPDMENI